MNRTFRIILDVVSLVFATVIIAAFVHGDGKVDLRKMIRGYHLERLIINIDKSIFPALPSLPNGLDILDVYKV